MFGKLTMSRCAAAPTESQALFREQDVEVLDRQKKMSPAGHPNLS